jgi:arylsulfatase A-like enzyme
MLLLSVVVPAHAEQPNILVFLVDDMGVMDTSVPMLGEKHPLNDYYRTPSMERLAAQGLSFSQFYANSVCSPSRISLMTGQSSARHRTTQWIAPPKKNTGAQGPNDWNWEGMNKATVSMPRLLQEAGYRTIHAGKGHFGPRNKEGADPRNIGFDVNIAGAAHGSPATYYGKEDFGLGGKRSHNAVPGLEKYHGQDIFLTEALTIEINKAIADAVEEKKPFFAYMSHYAVHGPFNSDPRFAGNYKDSDKNKNAQAFATLIEGIDKSLGDIMDNIEKLGVAENTLIIFLGDNGSDAPLGKVHGHFSSAPLRGKKGAHYEGGMRVPFIVAWSKPSDTEVQKKFAVKQGLLKDEFATIMDILPTLLTVAGIEAPKGHVIDGSSMLDLWGGKSGVHPQEFLMHFPHQHRSNYFTVYREKDWKLIYHYMREDDHYELFNLADDPYELKNIAATKPEVLQSMLKTMKREMDEADALYPVDKKTKEALRIE